MCDFYDRKDQLIVLAEHDDGGSYEVDITLIGLDKGTNNFVLVTASGCSCWDGSYDEESFDSFEALSKSLLDGDRRYYSSLKCSEALLTEAQQSLKDMKIT